MENKPEFDYARPDSTGHFHFRRQVQSGKNAGAWTGCQFGASVDDGNLTSTPRSSIPTVEGGGVTLDLILYVKGQTPELPEGFVPVKRRKRKAPKRPNLVADATPPKKPKAST